MTDYSQTMNRNIGIVNGIGDCLVELVEVRDAEPDNYDYFGGLNLTLPHPHVGLRALGGSFSRFIRPLSGLTYRWMYFEFFYSNMDRALFLSNNEFEDCLTKHFPNLKTRNLRRAEWVMIRRTLGKPRRLSDHFLSTERISFADNCEQIRKIQKRQVSTDIIVRDLPDEIPLHYIIGTRVTAMVRGLGMSGILCRGTIDGLDLKNNLYRISFDRQIIGMKSVMDYDVLSDEPPDTISAATISLKIMQTDTGKRNKKWMLKNYTSKLNSALPANGHLGGFRVRFLECIVRLRKLIRIKTVLLQHLKTLNTEAEKTCISRSGYQKDFIIAYATCIVSLDCISTQISTCLEAIDLECQMMSTSKGINLKVVSPQNILSTCDKEGELLVTNLNGRDDTMIVKNEKILHLITHLASLMYQLNKLSHNPNVWNTCDVHSTKCSLNKIRDILRGKNIGFFQSRIEIPVNRITAGIVHSNFEEFKKRPGCGYRLQ